MKILILIDPTISHSSKDEFIEMVLREMDRECLSEEDHELIVQQAKDFKMGHLANDLIGDWEDNK